MMRTSTLIVSVPPRRMNSRSWITRSSLACVSGPIVEIFVEENRALIGDFEEALFRGHRAGERALHVAEELRLQQVHGNRAGVDGHERLVRARGRGVNRLGDEFLACAAFAVNQDGRARRRHLADQVEHREHLVALADNVGEVVALLQSALELDVFLAQAAALDGLRDLHQQFIVGPGLGDVVLRAALERGPRHVDRTVGGDQDDGEVRVAPVDFAQQIETVAVGQADVEQKKIEWFFLEQRQAGLAGFGARGRVALRAEQQFQALANFRFVVDDQDGPLDMNRFPRRREFQPEGRALALGWSARRSFRRVP